MLDYAKIGLKIRQKRLEKKLSGEAAAELAGLPLKQYVMIESGKGRLTVEAFVRIILALDLNADQVLGTAGNELPSDKSV